MTKTTFHRAGRLLTLDKIGVSYGERVILRDVQLQIDNLMRSDGKPQGQTVSLLGPSGIGKTQLFRCIAGLQQPSQGTVSLNDSGRPVVAGEVGVVSQHYPLFGHRSILGNMLLSTSDRKKAMAALDRFGLADKAHLYPTQLSGGQRQRAAIAQQLLHGSQFLLMDEPFSGLDILSKLSVCEAISDIVSSDEIATVIIITHDIETSVLIADTLWVLGRERKADNSLIPGATIVKSFDLLERGLAYCEDANRLPAYHETVDEIIALFKHL